MHNAYVLAPLVYIFFVVFLLHRNFLFGFNWKINVNFNHSCNNVVVSCYFHCVVLRSYSPFCFLLLLFFRCQSLLGNIGFFPLLLLLLASIVFFLFLVIHAYTSNVEKLITVIRTMPPPPLPYYFSTSVHIHSHMLGDPN